MIKQIDFKAVYSLLNYLLGKPKKLVINTISLKEIGIKIWQCSSLFNILQQLGCIEKYEQISETDYFVTLKKSSFEIRDLIAAENLLIIEARSIEGINKENEILKQKLSYLNQELDGAKRKNKFLEEENRSLKKTRKTKAERIRDAMAN